MINLPNIALHPTRARKLFRVFKFHGGRGRVSFRVRRNALRVLWITPSSAEGLIETMRRHEETEEEKAIGLLQHLYLNVANSAEERLEVIRQLATYVPNKRAVGILEYVILEKAKSPEERMEILRALGKK